MLLKIWVGLYVHIVRLVFFFAFNHLFCNFIFTLNSLNIQQWHFKKECTNLFSTGGGESLAQEFDVEFLGEIFFTWYLFIDHNQKYWQFIITNIGRVPIDPSLTLMIENSYKDNSENGLIKEYPNSNLFKVFINITNKLVEKVTN